MNAQPTPQPKPASPYKALLTGLTMAAVGAVAGAGGFILASRVDAFGPYLGRLNALNAYDLLLLPVLFFLVILIHECGHLIGGIGRGMRFLLLIVGPLRLRRTVSGLKLDWFLRGDTLGGMAAALPPKGGAKPGQFLALVAGGPLASLLLAVAALVLSNATDGRLSAHLLILALLSAAIFVVTAIPMRAGGFMSDGRQFLELLRGGSAVEHRNALVAVYAESLSGVRPRDRDPEPLARSLTLAGQEPLRDVGTWIAAYQVALDHGDAQAAGGWLDKVAEVHDAYPNGFRQALAAEIAFFNARYRHDPETGAAWLARAYGGTADASSLALAEAAVALARGDRKAALEAALRGEQRLADSSDAGAALLLRDELAALRRDAETVGV
jgi:hypothetical protein